MAKPGTAAATAWSAVDMRDAALPTEDDRFLEVGCCIILLSVCLRTEQQSEVLGRIGLRRDQVGYIARKAASHSNVNISLSGVVAAEQEFVVQPNPCLERTQDLLR